MNRQSGKIVFFDIGKVLVDFDFNKAVDAWYAALGGFESKEELMEAFENDVCRKEFECGHLSVDDFLFRMLKASGVTYTASMKTPGWRNLKSKLVDGWGSIFTPRQKMIDFARSLCGEYFVGLASNTDPIHEKSWAKYVDRRHFVKLVLSHQVGVRKPSPDFYWYMFYDPSRVIFVDDMKENVDAFAEMGGTVVHADPELYSPEQIMIAVLENLADSPEELEALKRRHIH